MTRLRIRRVPPRAVARATLAFHASMVASLLLALAVLYGVTAALGSVGDVERSIRVVAPGFRLHFVSLMAGGLVLGLVEIAFATATNVGAARIYNLVAEAGHAIEVEVDDVTS